MDDVVMIDLSGIYGLEDIIKSAQAKNIQTFILSMDADIEEKIEKIDFFQNIGKINYNSFDELINII